MIAPGENGLLIGTEDGAAEAWCVQKSNFASRRGRLTRADRIANELLDVVELYDPPLENVETGVRIRRARPDESQLLTRLERAASEPALAHVFPTEQHPYPVTAVATRWRQLLSNRLIHAYLLEVDDSPVGYVAFDADTVHHLGVVSDHTRRGPTAQHCLSSPAWRSMPAAPVKRSAGCLPSKSHRHGVLPHPRLE